MDSVLVIDKPAGITSHDVVARVRKILGERSVGHLGTLDPSATGVLPLLTGGFTRLAQFFASADKTYEGIIHLGFATDTYDSDGEPVGTPQNIQVSLEQINQATEGFVGEIKQTPPAFSAKKVAGVRSYKLARKKQAVELEQVRVTVHSFRVTGLQGHDVIFSTQVSAGTYVRSLAHALGEKLGVGAHLRELRRTVSGEFTLAQAVTLERLAEVRQNLLVGSPGVNGFIPAVAVHPRTILPQLPSVTVTQEVAGSIRHGRAINLADFSGAKEVKIFLDQNKLIAIGTRVAGTLFQPKVVLISS